MLEEQKVQTQYHRRYVNGLGMGTTDSAETVRRVHIAEALSYQRVPPR